MSDPGVHILASPEGISSLSELLKLARFSEAGCVMTAAERVNDSIRMHFEWEGVGAGTVSVDAEVEAACFAHSHNLAFRFDAPEVSRPWAVLIARMAIESAGLFVSDLFRTAGVEGADVSGETDESGTAGVSRYNPMNEWGPESGWRQFMCDAAMERRFREAFEFDSDASFIVHGDLECRFVSPGARVRLPGYFVYPFDLFTHHEAVGPVTGLSDEDVIIDSTKRIETKVRQEIEDGAVRGPIVIVSTCVPVIVAEDPSNVLAGLAPDCPAGISYVTPVSPVAPTEIYMESFRTERERALSSAPVADTVGLVGYRPGRSRDELAAVLGDLGLSVSGGMVPMVNERLISAVLSARVTVTAPSPYHAGIFDRLLEGSVAAGRVRLEPPFPWGPSAASLWLESIAEAFGRKDAGVELARKHESRARERMDRLLLEVADSRGGADPVFLFVCEPGQFDRLVDPLSPAGLPLLAVMCDLGLRTRVVAYCPDEDESRVRDMLSETLKAVPRRELVDFSRFWDSEGLQGCLSAADVVAVYSEMFFDSRSSAAGLATFSSRIFEPGYDGAVRTAARFAAVARLPYYSRYGKAIDSRQAAWWHVPV